MYSTINIYPSAPFNLIALVIFRPLRLFLPSDNKIRQGRIILLKATHAPIVGVIRLYEWVSSKFKAKVFEGFQNAKDSRRHAMKRRLLSPPGRRDSTTRPSHRFQITSPRRTSVYAAEPRYRPRPLRTEEDSTDAPTDVEVRIAELSAKIDRLTSLVTTLHAGSGPDTTRVQDSEH